MTYIWKPSLQMTRNIIRHLGIRVLAQKPDLRHRDRHRFRYVRGQKDLEPFVALSDAEEVIAGVNPGLKGKKREKLYDRWCQWTVYDESLSWHDQKNRVKAFLILRSEAAGQVMVADWGIHTPAANRQRFPLSSPDPKREPNTIREPKCSGPGKLGIGPREIDQTSPRHMDHKETVQSTRQSTETF